MPRLIAIDPSQVYSYVPKICRDLPKDEQTSFSFTYPTGKQEAMLNDDSIESLVKGKESRQKFKFRANDLKLLELCLKGWDNFQDANGKDVPFSKENIDRIPSKIRIEIIDKIKQVDEKEGEEEENLE